MKTTQMILASTFIMLCAIFSFAEDFPPVTIFTPGECVLGEDVSQMCDGSLATVCTLLDDTRTGKKENVLPPLGSGPVTASFVVDFGEVRPLLGLRFTPPKEWTVTLPKSVSVYTCDDAQGTQNVQPLAEKRLLPPLHTSLPAFVSWDAPVSARFLLVRVNEGWGGDYNFWWWKDIWYGILKKEQRPIAGNGTRWVVQLAEVSGFSEIPSDFMASTPPERAYPESRLQRDWMYQDCGLDVTGCFASRTCATVEKSMLHHVLEEIRACDGTGDSVSDFEKRLAELENVPGADERWKSLYFDACKVRRALRLCELRKFSEQYVYTRHLLVGNPQSENEVSLDVTDEQFWDCKPIVSPGTQLCRLTIDADGSVKNEVLLELTDGMICDPAVSYDGRTLIFAMRRNFVTDDLNLYSMDLAKGAQSLTQLTFPLEVDGKRYPAAHRRPTFTPEGKILFDSTRCTQINDCWPRANTDIYEMNLDGTGIRRLTFDQLQTNHPRVLPDGRILYSRWEYNDRNAYFPHPLMTMNPDGTSQTEFYGNNSTYPCSLIQSVGVPGSHKVLAIVSGHHTHERGKLALVDRTLGTQNGVGIEFVAGASPDGTPGRKASFIYDPDKNLWDWEIDYFGQTGCQFYSPYAFDETHYLSGFCPEGWILLKGPYFPALGSYFMTADGRRELLAFDWKQASVEMIPLAPREAPPIRSGNSNLNESFGTFYIQNVYLGPGLQGVPEGSAKTLRILAMEYRPARMGNGYNRGESGNGPAQTPISIGNCSWDVKHVLGEVDIEADGSCCFYVPARQPVFFQVLDENGYCIQSMRSWATLQSGERFACLGCHENKNDVLVTGQTRPTLAMRNPVQMPRPFAGKVHPLMERLQTEDGLASVENYLGVNTPCVVSPDAPVAGFSYMQDVQPIWERHCVACHQGNENDPDPRKRSRLRLTSETVDITGKTGSNNYKKAFSQSYCALTQFGQERDNPYVRWLNARSRTQMLPPYFTGSSHSPLMKYLEPTHYDVQLSENEKRMVACWIDLCCVYCGSHAQHNTWTDAEKTEIQYFLDKRRAMAEEERQNTLKLRK